MKRMDTCVDAFRKRLASIAFSRVQPDMLAELPVPAYGGVSYLRDIATCSAQSSQVLLVQVWDLALVRSVEKAIKEFNIGFGLRTDGPNIFVKLPALSEERRLELVKTARAYAEDARVAVRQIRQDIRDKAKDQPQHIQNKIAKDVQERTDKCVAEINDILKTKELDIMKG